MRPQFFVASQILMDRLQSFQPYFPFVLRPGSADPYHFALHRRRWVIVWDNLDNRSASQRGTHAESKSPLGGIDYETGKSVLLSVSVLDNKAAPHFRY